MAGAPDHAHTSGRCSGQCLASSEATLLGVYPGPIGPCRVFNPAVVVAFFGEGSWPRAGYSRCPRVWLWQKVASWMAWGVWVLGFTPRLHPKCTLPATYAYL